MDEWSRGQFERKALKPIFLSALGGRTKHAQYNGRNGVGSQTERRKRAAATAENWQGGNKQTDTPRTVFSAGGELRVQLAQFGHERLGRAALLVLLLEVERAVVQRPLEIGLRAQQQQIVHDDEGVLASNHMIMAASRATKDDAGTQTAQ